MASQWGRMCVATGWSVQRQRSVLPGRGYWASGVTWMSFSWRLIFWSPNTRATLVLVRSEGEVNVSAFMPLPRKKEIVQRGGARDKDTYNIVSYHWQDRFISETVTTRWSIPLIMIDDDMVLRKKRERKKERGAERAVVYRRLISVSACVRLCTTLTSSLRRLRWPTYTVDIITFQVSRSNICYCFE